MNFIIVYKRKNQRQTSPTPARRPEQMDDLWRVHQLMIDWIGRFDTKAGLIVTLDAAGLAALWALTAPGRFYAAIGEGSLRCIFISGIILLIVSLLVAGYCIMPRTSKPGGSRPANSPVFFGDIKDLASADLQIQLSPEKIIGHLSSATIALARVAYFKQLLVRLAVMATLFSGLAFGFLALIIWLNK